MEIEPVYKYAVDNVKMISPDGSKEILFKGCVMESVEHISYSPYEALGFGKFRFESIEYREIDKETDFITANAAEIEELLFTR